MQVVCSRRPVCIGTVEFLPAVKIRQQRQQIGKEGFLPAFLPFVIGKAGVFEAMQRHKGRLWNVCIKVFLRPRADVLQEFTSARLHLCGTCQMIGLSCSIISQPDLHDRVGNVVHRDHIEARIGAGRDHAEFSQQHQFQNVIDRVEILHPSRAGIADDHSRTADGVW